MISEILFKPDDEQNLLDFVRPTVFELAKITIMRKIFYRNIKKR